MKKIGIVTGATGGLGREFVRVLLQEDIDEIWAAARNEEKLMKLKEKFGNKIVPICVDLSEMSSVERVAEKLKSEQPEVVFLVNNAGVGRMGTYKDFTIQEIWSEINLHCSAAASLCTICIPYMRNGSRILNMSSQASFQPVPYLDLYAASKVFVRSYTRALNVELKGTGITATAVCPGWVDTDLLMKEVNGKAVKFPGLTTAEKVVVKAVRDAKKGRDMSVGLFYVKVMHIMAKFFPQEAVMKTWMRQIKPYIQQKDATK
jgi:short-subunit dehydrogenase